MEEEKIACRFCGDEIAKRGVKTHERFCSKNPDRLAGETGPQAETPDESVLDELNVLKKILNEAGVKYRSDAISRAFSRANPDDLEQLDHILRLGDSTTPARRLILRNWAYHRNVEIPESLKAELEREESEESKKKSDKGASATKQVVEDLRGERRQVLEDMKLDREAMLLQRQIERLEGTDGKKKEEELVEMPVVNPQSGEPMFDAQGRPVLVHVNPEKEYRVQRMMASWFPSNTPKPGSENTILTALINQQTALIGKMLEGTTKTDTEDTKLMREEMREERRRYEDLLGTMRDDNLRLQREQMEERMRRLEYAVTNKEDDLEKFITTQERLKERGLMGGTDKEVEMMKTQRDAMNNSFALVRQQMSNLNENTKEIVGIAREVYPDVMKENVKERIRKRTKGAVPKEYSEAELESIAASLPPEESEESEVAPTFHVIGGKKPKSVAP